MTLPDTTLSYIAGFLDGDGSINAQIIPRKEYILKYQIRVSITFFQKTTHSWILLWIQKQCTYGTLRKRKYGMSEHTIVGKDPVKNILLQLHPWVKVKRPQLLLVLEIIQKLSKTTDPQTFLTLCESVDRFAQLNASKTRKITSATVRSTFES